MRFICLLIIAASVLISGVFGLLTYNNDKSVDKLAENKAALVEKIESYTAEVTTLQNTIDETTAKKTELETELVHLKKMASYKTEPTVFLTFDDGLSANSLKILDTLDENNIKGTFFVVGSQIVNNGEKAKEALRRIVSEGHKLGIHCYSHVYSELYKSKEAYFKDFDKVVALVEEITGTTPDIVRLPSGTFSAKLFCKKYSGSEDTYYEIVSELYARGYEVIDWNVETKDYTTSTGVKNIVQNAIDGANQRLTREYKTAVILMHDTVDTYTALPDIIRELKEITSSSGKSFRFETLENGGYVTRQVPETEKPNN